jgi:hypothetical protein
MTIRAWDFLFYLLFGVLITQIVGVLGVLPVFAYLVIPAVASTFLFRTLRARLLFGWAFAGTVSLVGLEGARVSHLDPGPTIVCLFAGALVLLGIGVYLRSHAFSRRALVSVLGFALLFSAFLGGTLLFRKPQRTNELATAIEFAKTGDATRLRQAMASFRRFPDARSQWYPLVVPMLSNDDPVARDEAVTLLVDTHTSEALEPLLARLVPGTEPEANVRENVIRAVRALGDTRAVAPLVTAAASEEEPDLAVAMAIGAFELGGPGQDEQLRRAADILVQVLGDDDAPRAARRDAIEAFRAHVALDVAAEDGAAIAAWWGTHRAALAWHAGDHRLAPGA